TVLAALVIAAGGTTFTLMTRRAAKDGEVVVVKLDELRANATATRDRPDNNAVVTTDPMAESRPVIDGTSQSPVDATAAPSPDSSRWSDVTKDTWQNLVRDDGGTEIRSAVTGLETESLDLVALLR